jgi:heavy metal sensor kinase
MAYWRDIPIHPQILEKLRSSGGRVFETIHVEGRGHDVRILYGIAGPGVLMQLGQSMADYSRFIGAFKRIFAITMAALAVLAVLVGWFMARKALSGLGEVTGTARRISGSELNERVPLSGRGDEIDQLAVTFNQMLDRIQDLITGIQDMNDNIAHDLKSPVAGIRGMAEIALTTNASLSEFKAMAGGAIEACDRLLSMIDTMLLISKTEAGVERVRFETLDAAGLVREACDLFQPLAEDKGVFLDYRVPDRCLIVGDTGMIQRMVSNLLDNAIKYTPPGGRVAAAVEETDPDQVVITITDTGRGIAEANLPHIFERFYRGDPSRAQSGSGLGLSLALAIARSHGGDIAVSSGMGEGATFTVKLPKKSQPTFDSHPAAAYGNSGGTRRS